MAKSFPNTGATVIDSAADLPTASAALEGILMFQKDTNELKICDGASWVSVIDTDNPPGMLLMKPTSVAGTNVSLSGYQVSFSTATTVSVNGCFTSAYNNYRIVIDSSTNTGSGVIRFKLRSGGSDFGSYTTSGYDSYLSGGTGYVTPLGTNNQAIAYAVVGVLGQASGRSGTIIDLFTPFSGGTTYTIGNFHSGGAANSTGMENFNGSFVNYAGGAIDGFTVYTSGTNWTGTLRVYGYHNG